MAQSSATAFFATFQRWIHLHRSTCIRESQVLSPTRNASRLHSGRHNYSTLTRRHTPNGSGVVPLPVLFKEKRGHRRQAFTIFHSRLEKAKTAQYFNKGAELLDDNDGYEALDTIIDPDRPMKKASNELRSMMRDMPHSVVVITVCAGTESWKPITPNLLEDTPLLSPYYKNFRGATISSMTTVTMGPPAYISLNLKEPSRTLEGIFRHRQFRVHFLHANPHGAIVANAFTQHHQADAYKHLAQQGHQVRLGGKDSTFQSPVISGPGVRAHLLCTVETDKCILVGDHMIVVAKVEGVEAPENELVSTQPCIMYSDRQYKDHGNPITIPEAQKDESLASLGDSNFSPHDDYHHAINGEINFRPRYPPLYRRLLGWVDRTEKMLIETGSYSSELVQSDSDVVDTDGVYLKAVLLDELLRSFSSSSDDRLAPIVPNAEALEKANALRELVRNDWESLSSEEKTNIADQNPKAVRNWGSVS